MADRIKGITVEIGGDTQGLDKALKGVNNTSRDLQKELRDVQKLLKFDPNNVELMAQKQKLLSDQIENTEKKLRTLKEAEAQVQAQFERGDIGIEQYRAFQRELQDTESYLRNTQNSLQDLQKEQQQVGESTKELDRLFEVTGKTIDDFADILGDRTVRAIQQGTASSKDLQRAFGLIAQASYGASADVDKIREAVQRLESGEGSIRGVRREINRLGEDAQQVAEDVKGIGSELGNLVIGAGAGMGIDAIFQKALDISELDTVIDISMEIPEESKKAVKSAITTVGQYIGDNETALAGVRKQFQLNAGLTDEENTRIVKGAGTIVKAYADVDFSELIQETHEMALGMHMTHEEALGMTKSLLDMGFPEGQLDIISEYGQQLARAGYSAGDIQAIFEAGIETGTWNIDNLMDGLKEGRILLSEYGTEVPKAVKEALKGTEISSQMVKDWGTAMAKGGEDGKKAMMDVSIALSGIDDETKRNELGVMMFGTMWEEQGKMISETILGATGKTVDLSKGTQQLATDTAKIDASPTQQLNTALSTLWTTLQPLLTKVIEFTTEVVKWIQQNPELTATVLAIVSALGILTGIILAVTTIFNTLRTTALLLTPVIMGISTPVLVVVGVILLLIGIGVLLYKNWDTIMEFGKKLGKSISESFEKMSKAVGEFMGKIWTKVEEIWGNVMDFFGEIDLVQTGKDIIQGLIDGISNMAGNVSKAVSNIASGIGEKVKEILKLGSPSKLLMDMGEDTGEGLAIGIDHSLKRVQRMANKMGQMAIPENMNVNVGNNNQPSAGKQISVNIHSPKALDVREATREFNRTLNKMSLMW